MDDLVQHLLQLNAQPRGQQSPGGTPSMTGGMTLAQILSGSDHDGSYAEPPDALARMGRGMTDVYEPVLSLYYRLTDPNQARAYDAQRMEDEALYLHGARAAPSSDIVRRLLGIDDPWRWLGQSVLLSLFGPAAMKK